MDTETFQPPATKHALKRGLISGGFGLGLVVISTLAITQTEIADGAITDLIARARLGPLLLSWAMVPLAFYFLGRRWRALIPQPYTPPGGGLAAILSAGLLINTALPGPVGEFGAAWFAHKRYGVPLPISLASGVGARLVGVWMAAAAAVLVWVIADLPTPQGWDLAIAGVAAVIGATGLGLGLIALKPHWVKRISEYTLNRGGQGRIGRALGTAHTMVCEVADAQASLRGGSARGMLACIAWSFIAHLIVITGIAVAIWSVGATPSMAGLLFTYAATTAGVIIMFALPGSQVGWDALFLTLLVSTAGMNTPDALLITVVVRVQQLSVMVAGAVALSWLLKGKNPSSSEE